MAKAKAVLEKRPVKEGPPPKKTVDLWCDTCHTKWIEACLQAWKKCPFVDCKGMLRPYRRATGTAEARQGQVDAARGSNGGQQ